MIDTAEQYGVRSYIFVPCIVYGEGEGFGNRTSIQDVAIVKAAKKAQRVHKVDIDNPVSKPTKPRLLVIHANVHRPGLSATSSIILPYICKYYARYY